MNDGSFIIIDDREHQTKNLFTIQKKIQRLDSGDYHIYVNNNLEFIIERKSLKDLSASIKDKRIYKQLEKLKTNNIYNYCFIIEGDKNTYIKLQKNKKFHLLPLTSLNTKLQHMEADGIKLYYVNDIQETVKFIETYIFPRCIKRYNMLNRIL
jgi:ERCC4-type nuclease